MWRPSKISLPLVSHTLPMPAPSWGPRAILYIELSNGFSLCIKSWFLTVSYKALYDLISGHFSIIFFFLSLSTFITLQLIPFISIHLETSCHRSSYGFSLLFILALIQILLLQIPLYLKVAPPNASPSQVLSHHLPLYSLYSS